VTVSVSVTIDDMEGFFCIRGSIVNVSLLMELDRYRKESE